MGIGDTDGMGGLSMPENLEADLEIEIEDPESVTITTPDMEIVIDPDAMEDDEAGGDKLKTQTERLEQRRYTPYKFSGKSYSFDMALEKGVID